MWTERNDGSNSRGNERPLISAVHHQAFTHYCDEHRRLFLMAIHRHRPQEQQIDSRSKTPSTPQPSSIEYCVLPVASSTADERQAKFDFPSFQLLKTAHNCPSIKSVLWKKHFNNCRQLPRNHLPHPTDTLMTRESKTATNLSRMPPADGIGGRENRIPQVLSSRMTLPVSRSHHFSKQEIQNNMFATATASRSGPLIGRPRTSISDYFRH